MTIGGVAPAGAVVAHPAKRVAVTSAAPAIARPKPCHTLRFFIGNPSHGKTESGGASPAVILTD